MENLIKKPLGVIDALSGGFEIIIHRPWVLLIPIALDLFLWLGPQATATPVFQQTVGWLSAAPPPGAPQDTAQNLDAVKNAWLAVGQKLNVFVFIALWAIGVPTFIGLDVPPADFLKTRFGTISIEDGATLAVLIILLTFLGIFLASVYLESIARGVRHDGNGARAFAPRMLKSYLNTTALMLFGMLGAIATMIPFVLSAALLAIFSQELGSFLFVLGLVLLLLAALYLVFAIPAIFVSGVNVPQAVVNSITVLRYNFWSAMGLILLIYLIERGFAIVWQQFLDSSFGVFVDMIANAFLGSGLVAAGMLFYYDRITWLNQVREQIRQHRPPVKG